MMPALFTRTPTGPNCRSAAPKSNGRQAGLPTSPFKGKSLSGLVFDCTNNLVCGGFVAGVIDHNRVAIPGEALCDGCADALARSGYDGGFQILCHTDLLLLNGKIGEAIRRIICL